jgi:hypothetical protein
MAFYMRPSELDCVGALALCSRVPGGSVSQRMLHNLTCGRDPRASPHHNASYTRRRPGGRDPPETRQLMAANEEDGRVPRVAVGGCSVDDNLYI